MSASGHVAKGACHCGTIRVTLETARAPGGMELRACQCNFCTRAGARMVSDPAGRVEFEIGEPPWPPYRFGTGTADFLICPHCGVFAAATFEDGGKAYAVINTRGLAMAAFADAPCTSVDFDVEGTGDRLTRRKARWTPAVIRYNNARGPAA